MLVNFQKLSEHLEEQKMLIFKENTKICILYIDDFESLLTEKEYIKYKNNKLKQINIIENKLFDLAIKIYGEL